MDFAKIIRLLYGKTKPHILPHSIEITLKWIIDLNLRAKTILKI